MELIVKNMVCDRCILVVRQVLEQAGLKPKTVQLGQVELEQELSEEQRTALAAALQSFGFELVDDRRKQLSEQLKALIIERIHHGDPAAMNVNFSTWLAEQTGREYSSLSRNFSETEQITLEQYIIRQKIEKVKELIGYGELNFNEIAYRMGYSSSAHLSAQFKKITGLTPSEFRDSGISRKPIDQI